MTIIGFRIPQASLNIENCQRTNQSTNFPSPKTMPFSSSYNLLKDFATQKHCNAWRNSIVAHNGNGPGENLLRGPLNETSPGCNTDLTKLQMTYQSWNVKNSTQFNINTPLTPNNKFNKTSLKVEFPSFLRIGPANIQQNIHFNQGILTISLHISDNLQVDGEGWLPVISWNGNPGNVSKICVDSKNGENAFFCVKMNNAVRCLSDMVPS